jgi:hypothetical protein
MYRIQWKITETGASGHGKPMSLELATSWVEHMTKIHPEMSHWVQQVPNEELAEEIKNALQ